jgi:hypothetical protein
VTAGKYNDGTPQARKELAERLFAGMKASAASTRLAPVERIEWRIVPVQLTPRTDAGRDPEENRSKLENPEEKSEVRLRAAGRLACYERLQKPIELTSFWIGPARIVHLPGEPMIEFQHFAQQVLAGEFVAVAGYGLATPGYVCTEKAFEEGGYEPSASDVVPESEKVVKRAIRRLLTAE